MSHFCLSVFYIKSLFFSVGKTDSEIYYLPVKKSHQTDFCSGDPDAEELRGRVGYSLSGLKPGLMSCSIGNKF